MIAECIYINVTAIIVNYTNDFTSIADMLYKKAFAYVNKTEQYTYKSTQALRVESQSHLKELACLYKSRCKAII